MNILRLILCLVATVTAFAGSGPAPAPAPAPAPVPVPVPVPLAANVAAARPEYFQFAHMHEMHLDRARVAPVGLLFLGDSITEAWWNVADFWWQRYGAYQPANFGISGDRTQHVIWRLEHGMLEHAAPRVVVLMIGTNNSGDNSAEEITAGIREILDLIQARRPDTKVLLLGIFPRDQRTNWQGKPDNWERRMPVIRAVNQALAGFDDGRRVRFLDIGHVFLDPQGNIPRELMPDQLHLSNSAYRLWADAMQPLLDEMLSMPPKTPGQAPTGGFR
jgi:beta-glucosidase